MDLSISMIVLCLTLIAGQITKLTKIDNKWIPLQNIIIAIIASIVCIIFKVQNLSPIETIVSCVIATMSAGGISDLTKLGINTTRSIKEKKKA